jgi:hypothetical protein
MDAQNFRSLQEAYSQVYELDEGYMPATQKRADKMRKQVSKLRRTASEKGDFGHPESEKKHNQADTVLRFSRLTSDLAKKRDKDAKKSEFNEDIYDIILSHLLDEGYADTQEAAEAIMVNMSEEWRNVILDALDEGYKPLPKDRIKNKAKKLAKDTLSDVGTTLNPFKSDYEKDVAKHNMRKRQTRVDKMVGVLKKTK